MQFKILNHAQTFPTEECVTEVISSLSFYSEYARANEIEKFSVDNLWTFVKDSRRYNVVAIDNNNVVGFLFGVVDGNVLFVSWIGMRNEYKRSGHMETLWAIMEGWCKQNNIHKVWCDTNQLNIPAISFMKKMNMNQCGDLKNFWYGHDYFLWEKSINE